LERIGLYIEQKNGLSDNFNHWDSVIDDTIVAANERLFYKCWLWLSYIEFEQIIVNPPEEVLELLCTWKYNFAKASVEACNTKGEIARKLIVWAKANLELE
jgi:hypothetical protein